MHHPICENWDSDACEIKLDNGDKPEKLGKYFRISGTAKNVHEQNCKLPHLRLDVEFLDAKGKSLELGVLGEEVDDPNAYGCIIHVSDRAVSPGETAKFKLEGLWNDKIKKVNVKTRPKVEPHKDIPPSVPEELKFEKLNSWQDEISLGSKSAIIQRGDILLDAGPAEGVISVFSAMIAIITNSPYHHAMVYDCDWNVVHATWPKVERNTLEKLYLNMPEAVLSWVRPKYRDAKPVTESDADKALEFASKQIGCDYDLIANAGFLFRADGLPEMPVEIEKIFQNRNWLSDHKKWHCSELAAGAWWLGAGLELVEDMRQKDFLSPADIYTSHHHDVVCTLIIKNGRPRLYTK